MTTVGTVDIDTVLLASSFEEVQVLIKSVIGKYQEYHLETSSSKTQYSVNKIRSKTMGITVGHIGDYRVVEKSQKCRLLSEIFGKHHNLMILLFERF